MNIQNTSDPYVVLKKVEQMTEAIGNPTTLLIERIFWLMLGGFLGLALLTSFLRNSKDSKSKARQVDSDQLKNLAKKAIQQNSNSN